MNDAITCSAGDEAPLMDAPGLPWEPPQPRKAAPAIALIGCGGIAPYHLAAYNARGYGVTALCDVDIRRAEQLATDYAPGARTTANPGDILADPEVRVIDLALHPGVRGPLIERALRAGKHVLSQKPFVENIDEGRRLVDLARDCGCLLAVNQNGRWAPHFSYMREAIHAGLIGEVTGIACTIHWDHSWTADTEFDAIHHLILYDFGIHWFDFVATIMGTGTAAESVYATTRRTPTQKPTPPMLATAVLDYPSAIATLSFNGDVRHGPSDTTRITGTKGSIESHGPDLNTQTVTLHTAEGTAVPRLDGDWFTFGFQGTMGELLCAIEEERLPANDAETVLAGHATCFAAANSAGMHTPFTPVAAKMIL